MATIDIKGLLGGKRLLRCSAQARWRFPYYYLLSNSYARIELDFEAIANHFISFRGSAPTPEDVEKDFEEYRTHHLLFVYRAGIRTWGQWDTPRDKTVRHKDAASKRSPHPPEKEYQEWLKEHHPEDWGVYHWSPKPQTVSASESVSSEMCGNFPKSSEELGTFPRGVGVGVGGGVGKTNPLPPLGPAALASPEKPETEPAAEIDIDPWQAGQALCDMLGIGGGQNRSTARDACAAVKRRKPDMRFTDIPELIQKLWREYDAQAVHAKVSLKTFLGEIGRFMDSDTWRVQASRDGPQVDEHGGHFEGTVYVTKEGKRMPGYIPPPKPKAKGNTA